MNSELFCIILRLDNPNIFNRQILILSKMIVYSLIMRQNNDRTVNMMRCYRAI